MTEYILQFLWQYKILDQQTTLPSTGEKVEIISPGLKNNDAGPDFFNAKIKIGQTLWAGNVEIHLKSSLWYQHKHHLDPAYDNVILHVVLEDDQITKNTKEQAVPTLSVSIPEHIKENYSLLQNEKRWLKCGYAIHKLDSFLIAQYLDTLSIERLEYKTNTIIALLYSNQNNWEQTCYTLLARNFGFHINAEPFQILAQRIPLFILLHYINNIKDVEALLFGTAGFLDELLNEDDYYQSLNFQYRHLQHKHNLKPLDKHLWKFAKTRPTNFPTVRIAQFAGLYFQHQQLFSKIIEAIELPDLQQLFITEISVYWKKHYRFNTPAKARNKHIGAEAINGILINSVIPLLFTYGKLKGNSGFCERALLFLDEIKAEHNSKITQWEMFGISAGNARETQALIHLRNHYCDMNKCLQCKIGHKVLTSKTVQ